MTISRWASLVFAVAFQTHAFVVLPADVAPFLVLYMLIPMSAIWFGEEMGRFVGGFFRPFHAPTPGVMVNLAGWILLLLTPVAVIGAKAKWELTN